MNETRTELEKLDATEDWLACSFACLLGNLETAIENVDEILKAGSERQFGGEIRLVRENLVEQLNLVELMKESEGA